MDIVSIILIGVSVGLGVYIAFSIAVKQAEDRRRRQQENNHQE